VVHDKKKHSVYFIPLRSKENLQYFYKAFSEKQTITLFNVKPVFDKIDFVLYFSTKANNSEHLK